MRKNLLCLLALLGSITARAYDIADNGFYYKITDVDAKTVEVTYGEDGEDNANYYSGEITIPQCISNGGVTYTVNAIGDKAFKHCSGLTSITIPEGVTSVGFESFMFCYQLKSVSLPDGLLHIGISAFDDCYALADITIPSTVSDIEGAAFSDCRSLTSITLPEGIPSVGSWFFDNCLGLTEIVIPESVTAIGQGAFASCTNLRILIINNPNPVTLGEDALDNTTCTIFVPAESVDAYKATEGWSTYTDRIQPQICLTFTAAVPCGDGTADLTFKVTNANPWEVEVSGSPEDIAGALTIPATVQNESGLEFAVKGIGEGAFQDRYNLTSIMFPSTLTAIGHDAFRDCANLESIDFNGCSAYVESQCFLGCSSLEEVYIPNTIQFRNSDLSWSWKTFGWCKSLKKVVFEAFGEEQTEYPARWSTTTMFDDCTSLETVVLPSLSVVEHQFFQNCKNLKTVTILEVEDDFDANLHNYDKKFGDSKAGQIQFIVPDGTAEKMLKAGYLYLSDLSGLPLIRQEFEEEAARITAMAAALTDGDKEALSAAITEARTTINAAEDYATAYAQIAAVKTAAKTFLTTANYALGFDVTAAYINNPDFSRLQIGWSTPGDYVVWPDENHRGYQANLYQNGDILIRDFIESWENSVRNSALQDGVISQVITNLPAGVYRLECDAIATWQGDDSVEVTGVSLFAGEAQTAVATVNSMPQHFSVEFTNLTTADVEIGIRARETNANWMAADNFRLYYIDAVGDVSKFDDAVYIEPVSARIGGDVEIAVCLKNAQAASAYNFDLVLPEGVTIAKGSNGKYIDALSDRHSDHSPTLNYKEADNVYSFATLSGNSEALTGNDGAIRLVTLHVADDVAEGTYPIYIKNATYSLPDGSIKDLENTVSSITLENYILGDVNGNNMVDIGDAVSIVNFLVGKPSSTFIEKAADTNKNNQIDIGDAVTIVNFLVGKTANLSRSTRTTMDEKEPQ